MATIPEFERRRLASSVVGTPGVNRAGAIIGNSVADAAGQVQKTAFSIAVDRQEAKDAALANKTLIDFDLKMSQAYQKHQDDYAQFRGDKSDRVKAFQTQADELFRATAEAIPSRGARDLFDRHGYTVQRGYLDKEITASDANQAVLAYSDTVDSVNLLAQRAASVGRDTTADMNGKRAALAGLLKQGETTFAAAQGVLSAEQREKLKTAIPESISKGFLLSSMDRNPEQVAEMLNDGTFDKILSADEKTKLMSDARAAIPKVKERREIDTILAGITTHQGMWDKYVSQDPSLLNDLEQNDDEFSKAMKNLVIKGDPDPVIQANDVMKLEAKFNSITKGGKGKEINKKTQLTTLQEFMLDVVNARERGSITSDVANSYLKKIADPMYQKIKVEHQGAKTPTNVIGQTMMGAQPAYALYQLGTSVINNFFGRNNRTEDVDAKSAVILDYLQKFDHNNIKTPTDAAALARGVVNNRLVTENPGMGLISGTPNKILHADSAQTMVQDGESDVKDRVKVPAKNTNQVFQDGDERQKNGVWYVRKDGVWRVKKQS